jgi:hypothetical protein
MDDVEGADRALAVVLKEPAAKWVTSRGVVCELTSA